MSEIQAPESSNRRKILAMIIAGTVGLTAGYVASRTLVNPDIDPSSIPGLLWPARTLTPFELHTTDNIPLNLDRLMGNWNLFFFGFMNCPDVCPTTLSIMASAMESMNGTEAAENTRVFFVSVDPNRDKIDKLGKYVQFFDESFVGATGKIEEINKLTDQLNVLHVRGDPDDNGNYSVDHSASVLIVGPSARRVGILSTPHTSDGIVSKFTSIREFVEAQS